jgi:hypothetical protein
MVLLRVARNVILVSEILVIVSPVATLNATINIRERFVTSQRMSAIDHQDVVVEEERIQECVVLENKRELELAAN